LKEVDIELLFSATIGPVRDILMRSGSNDAMKANKQFMSIEDAVDYIESVNADETQRTKLSLQYNSSKSLFSRVFKK